MRADDPGVAGIEGSALERRDEENCGVSDSLDDPAPPLKY